MFLNALLIYLYKNIFNIFISLHIVTLIYEYVRNDTGCSEIYEISLVMLLGTLSMTIKKGKMSIPVTPVFLHWTYTSISINNNLDPRISGVIKGSGDGSNYGMEFTLLTRKKVNVKIDGYILCTFYKYKNHATKRKIHYPIMTQ